MLIWEKKGVNRGRWIHFASSHSQNKDNNKFRNNNNKKTQNCKKIELYGSRTTMELKKEHTFRVVGGEGWRRAARAERKCSCGWQTQWSYICMRINQEEQLGIERDCTTPGSNAEK